VYKLNTFISTFSSYSFPGAKAVTPAAKLFCIRITTFPATEYNNVSALGVKVLVITGYLPEDKLQLKFCFL